MSERRGIGGYIILAIIVLVLVTGIFGGCSAFTQVQAGNVNLITEFGEVVDTFEEGLNWKKPFVQGDIVYEIRVKTYETSNNPDTSNADWTDFVVSAQTGDGQQITIGYTVRFHVPGENAADVYRNIGQLGQVVENIVKADSRSWTRKLAQNYDADSLFQGPEIQHYEDEVRAKLLETYADAGVVLDEFLVRKIDFDADYVLSIESQQIEQERILTEQFAAEAAVFEAQKLAETAKGEAQAEIERARGAAEARIINAEADAEAILIAAEARADAIALEGRALDLYPVFLEQLLIQNLDAKWILPGESLYPLLPLE